MVDATRYAARDCEKRRSAGAKYAKMDEPEYERVERREQKEESDNVGRACGQMVELRRWHAEKVS